MQVADKKINPKKRMLILIVLIISFGIYLISIKKRNDNINVFNG